MQMQRVSFTDEMDILMLREVVASQAFLQRNGQGWKKTTENLIKLSPFPAILTSRTVRDRTTLLLNHFKKENTENERRSGIEEDVTEKSVLLQEILSLKAEVEKSVMEGRKKDEEEKAAGEAVRNLAMTGLREEVIEPSDQPSTSSTSSSTGVTVTTMSGSSDHLTPKRRKRKGAANDDMLAFFAEREKQRRKEKEEEMAERRKEKEEEMMQRRREKDDEIELKRMELEMQRVKQQEEFRLRREAEEFAREERSAFLDIMKCFLNKLNQ